jgi:hypothetical protein
MIKRVLLHIADHQHVLAVLATLPGCRISVNFHYVTSNAIGVAAEGSQRGLVRDPITAFGWRDLRKSQKKN